MRSSTALALDRQLETLPVAEPHNPGHLSCRGHVFKPSSQCSEYVISWSGTSEAWNPRRTSGRWSVACVGPEKDDESF